MGKHNAEKITITSEENAEDKKKNKKKEKYFYWRYDDGNFMLCRSKGKHVQSVQTLSKSDFKKKKKGKKGFNKLEIDNGLLEGLTGEEMMNYARDDLSVLSDAFSDIKQLVEDYSLGGDIHRSAAPLNIYPFGIYLQALYEGFRETCAV